jgi:hypothetical protein
VSSSFQRTLVVVAAMGVASVVVWRTCRSLERAEQAPERAVQEVGRAAAEIAERFRTGRITTTFTEALPRLSGGGALLELASFEATETLRRTDRRSVLFDLIPLGTNVTEIRVPVTYRYHVVLADPWQLSVRGPVCHVRAPRLRPSLPPAIHTDRMEKRSERGWARWDVERQMEELERSLTPVLAARAGRPAQAALVREPCRRQLAGLVRTWLLGERQWGDRRFTAVTVAFADEEEAPASREPSPASKE